MVVGYRKGLGGSQCRNNERLSVIADLQGLEYSDSYFGYRAASMLAAGLRRARKRNLPAGKHGHGGMALEGTSKNLRPLDT